MRAIKSVFLGVVIKFLNAILSFCNIESPFKDGALMLPFSNEDNVLSSTTSPSNNRIRLVATSFTKLNSWVTSNTSLSLATFFNNSIMLLAVVWSKLPVGSSATKIGASLASARAIDTRCF